MYCPLYNRRPKQSGAALVVALLVFALSAALMVGLQRDFSLFMARSSNTFTLEQGWQFLRGAESLAAAALAYDAKQDTASEQPRDDLTEIWAQRNAPYALPGGGWLVGELQDLQGRLNLNNLATEGAPPLGSAGTGAGEQPRFGPTQQQLIRLLQTLDGLEIDEVQAIQLTEAISDFIDADGERRLEGAEAEAYRNLTPGYLASNQPFVTTSELRSVQGMTPAIYRALAPFITVWPATGGTLNLLTMPEALFYTLNVKDNLSPLSTDQVLPLLEARGAGEIGTVEELLNHPVLAELDMAYLADSLDIRSAWFLLTAQVELGEREMRMWSVLERLGEQTRVVSRAQGEP
jgi:general secretion pathway protein K